MLSSISWLHYIAALVIITVLYYLYVVHRYYQTEIRNFFNGKKDPLATFVGIPSASISVMGQVKPDHAITLTDTQELHFVSVSPDDDEVLTAENPVSDSSGNTAVEPGRKLIQEAGDLIEAFQDIDNKPEFLALLKILIDSNKRFGGEIDLVATQKNIVERSKEKLQFPISLVDLQGICGQ